MSNVYVILTSGGVLGKIIRWLGIGHFNHALLIDALDVHDRRTWVVWQSNWRGVTRKYFERSDLCEYYKILCAPDLPVSKVDDIIYYARGCKGKLYGWETIPKLLAQLLQQWCSKLLGRPLWRAQDLSYVCSEFVAACFAGGGWPLFGPDKILVLPDDYLELAEKGILTIIVERDPPPAHAKLEEVTLATISEREPLAARTRLEKQ